MHIFGFTAMRYSYINHKLISHFRQLSNILELLPSRSDYLTFTFQEWFSEIYLPGVATKRLHPSDICGNWDPVATPEQTKISYLKYQYLSPRYYYGWTWPKYFSPRYLKSKYLSARYFYRWTFTSVGNGCTKRTSKWEFARLVKDLKVKGWNKKKLWEEKKPE